MRFREVVFFADQPGDMSLQVEGPFAESVALYIGNADDTRLPVCIYVPKAQEARLRRAAAAFEVAWAEPDASVVEAYPHSIAAE